MLLLNLTVLTVLAFLISAIFGPRPLLVSALQGSPVEWQAMCGFLIGLAVAVPAWMLVENVRPFTPFRRQMHEFAGRLDLQGLNPLWMGLCAGIGEEMLFRGALQPLVGLWATSLVFTLLHYQTGGFRTMNRMKWVYAALVLLASLLLGYIFDALGLIAAAFTHSTIDVVGLVALRRDDGRCG
jgi:membrane protease YdiL (CAAX protease family)